MISNDICSPTASLTVVCAIHRDDHVHSNTKSSLEHLPAEIVATILLRVRESHKKPPKDRRRHVDDPTDIDVTVQDRLRPIRADFRSCKITSEIIMHR